MLEIEEREAERGEGGLEREEEDRVVSQLPSELLPPTFQAISGNRQNIIVFYQDTACMFKSFIDNKPLKRKACKVW